MENTRKVTNDRQLTYTMTQVSANKTNVSFVLKFQNGKTGGMTLPRNIFINKALIQTKTYTLIEVALYNNVRLFELLHKDGTKCNFSLLTGFTVKKANFVDKKQTLLLTLLDDTNWQIFKYKMTKILTETAQKTIETVENINTSQESVELKYYTESNRWYVMNKKTGFQAVTCPSGRRVEPFGNTGGIKLQWGERVATTDFPKGKDRSLFVKQTLKKWEQLNLEDVQQQKVETLENPVETAVMSERTVTESADQFADIAA
ncbi:MAG: hypothetical protein FWG64_06125 [Firmicutes bacterium]|nr:hypothetical protein [Bacillota bacterium]